MTEKEIYSLQNDIYWMVIKQFNGKNIPPLLQKMIMEGIYSRFQTNALQYDWDLQIQDYAEKNKKDSTTVETETIPINLNEGNSQIINQIKDSNGVAKEIDGEVSYE